MSSLAATQADGYYISPEYYTSGQYKKKSISQFNGSKGHNQFLQKGIVRFELPYDGFCLSCGTPISRGSRFNASKVKVGNYLTSPIYEFRMKCPACPSLLPQMEFVIRTNPKEQTFDYVNGIHKRVLHEGELGETQTHDEAHNSTTACPDKYTGNNHRLVERANRDSLAHLESIAKDKQKATTERDALETLIKLNQTTFGVDSFQNSQVRNSFRKERNAKKARIEQGAKLGWASGMEVLTEVLDDVIAAKSITYSDGKKTERKKLRQIRSASMFDSITTARTTNSIGVQTSGGLGKTESTVPSRQTNQRETAAHRKSNVKHDATPDHVASQDCTGIASSHTVSTSPSVKPRKQIPLLSIARKQAPEGKSIATTSLLHIMELYDSESE